VPTAIVSHLHAEGWIFFFGGEWHFFRDKVTISGKQWHFQGKNDIFVTKVIFFWSSYFFREKRSGHRRPHHRHTSPIIWTGPAAPNENSLAIGVCLTVSPFSSSSSIWHNVICSISKSGKLSENYILEMKKMLILANCLIIQRTVVNCSIFRFLEHWQ